MVTYYETLMATPCDCGDPLSAHDGQDGCQGNGQDMFCACSQFTASTAPAADGDSTREVAPYAGVSEGGAATPDSGPNPCLCGDPESDPGPYGCPRMVGPDEVCACRAFIPALHLVCGRCNQPIGDSAWFRDDGGKSVTHPHCYFMGATCELAAVAS